MTAPQSDYALLTEHFGYPPVSLLDDIINTVNVLADRALDSVERLLLSIPPQKLGFSAKKSKSKNTNASADPDPDPGAGADLLLPLPPDEAAKLEIESGTHQLETLLNASIDKTFDVFELYVMQNILNVKEPDQPFMRLSHYAGLDFSQLGAQDVRGVRGAQDVQDVQDVPTTESITTLRRRLQASQKLNAALEADKARNDALLRNLRSLVGAAQQQQQPVSGSGDTNGEGTAATATATAATATASPAFAFLRERAGLEEGGGAQPVTTTVEFTLSQLQAVRSLSESLRKLLHDLAAADADADADVEAGPRSWRRERAEYIESSSRKYLETVVGLELSAAGEVRDGDWQGQGRGLSKGDVEGLEKIVALLDGARRAKEDEPMPLASIDEESTA